MPQTSTQHPHKRLLDIEQVGAPSWVFCKLQPLLQPLPTSVSACICMQRVVACIEIAAQVSDELSKIGAVDKEKTTELCAEFLNNIKVHANCLCVSCSTPA